ncbi:undecaprenyl-diphosphate phosphatase [Candidatus Margulisiibacteriota bacterium]
MKYLILGIVQGLTEFLPVSSSGHLVIFTKLLNLPTDLFFDALVHVATLLAVAIYFRKEILDLLKGFFAGMIQVIKTRAIRPALNESIRFKIACWILVGTFATGVIGISFEDYFEGWFDSLFHVGCFLLLTGALILLAEWLGSGTKKEKGFTRMDALIIGAAQGCAIAPGLSRSGATISMALLRDLDRKLAARFSFLLSIPAILGAALFQLKDLIEELPYSIPYVQYALGFVAAFVSGYWAIKIFMNLIQKSSLRPFAYYCFIIGVIVLLFNLV